MLPLQGTNRELESVKAQVSAYEVLNKTHSFDLADALKSIDKLTTRVTKLQAANLQLTDKKSELELLIAVSPVCGFQPDGPQCMRVRDVVRLAPAATGTSPPALQHAATANRAMHAAALAPCIQCTHPPPRAFLYCRSEMPGSERWEMPWRT
jgi:hypothetical protein